MNIEEKLELLKEVIYPNWEWEALERFVEIKKVMKEPKTQKEAKELLKDLKEEKNE